MKYGKLNLNIIHINNFYYYKIFYIEWDFLYNQKINNFRYNYKIINIIINLA